LKTPLDISSGLTRDQKKHKKVCGALSYPTTTDIKIAQKEKTKKPKNLAVDPVFDLTLSLKTTGHKGSGSISGLKLFTGTSDANF